MSSKRAVCTRCECPQSLTDVTESFEHGTATEREKIGTAPHPQANRCGGSSTHVGRNALESAGQLNTAEEGLCVIRGNNAPLPGGHQRGQRPLGNPHEALDTDGSLNGVHEQRRSFLFASRPPRRPVGMAPGNPGAQALHPCRNRVKRVDDCTKGPGLSVPVSR